MSGPRRLNIEVALFKVFAQEFLEFDGVTMEEAEVRAENLLGEMDVPKSLLMPPAERMKETAVNLSEVPLLKNTCTHNAQLLGDMDRARLKHDMEDFAYKVAGKLLEPVENESKHNNRKRLADKVRALEGSLNNALFG